MIKENIENVKKAIEKIKGCSFEDSGITLIAVTKQKPVSDIIEAIDSGIEDLSLIHI